MFQVATFFKLILCLLCFIGDKEDDLLDQETYLVY